MSTHDDQGELAWFFLLMILLIAESFLFTLIQ